MLLPRHHDSLSRALVEVTGYPFTKGVPLYSVLVTRFTTMALFMSRQVVVASL